ncbi:MAG: chitosanase [Candidatus Sericytochromatia bacterium]|nr:chitosanase [Candidatus Sericytochromatia bacterium]
MPDGGFGLTDAQKHRAEALISLFENGTQTLQYGYVENLGDGRGYTAGRAGFTTGTGDLLQVVRAYRAQMPMNALSGYLPRLEVLAAAESDDITGLDGLPEAWALSAKDPVFRQAQDAVVELQYYRPAMVVADALGLRSAFAKTALYDAIIQHGDGEDADGLPALVAATNQAMGGSPDQGIDEQAWLRTFFSVRRADLAFAHDPATRAVWAESVSRVDVQRALLDSGNLKMQGPLHFHYHDALVDIP